MQSRVDNEPKTDETDDELDELDLQEAIQASLRATHEPDREHRRSFAQPDIGMTSGFVPSVEATTRVENLLEHAVSGIVPEGIPSVHVDSNSGMAPHDPFHFETPERHVVGDSCSVSSVRLKRSDSRGSVPSNGGGDGEEDDGKLPAVAAGVAAELSEDNRLGSSPLPDFVDIPFASLPAHNDHEDHHHGIQPSDLAGFTPPPDVSHAAQAPLELDHFHIHAEPFVFVNESVGDDALQIQEADANYLGRRRSSESPHPEMRAVRQRVIHFQPTQEEIEEAQQRSRRALLDLHAWYDRMNELNDYRRIHGNCRAPQVDSTGNNYPLGVWVAKQRSQRVLREAHRRTSMTQGRIDLLDSIGFDWGTRRGDAAWTARYNELLEYYHANGHSNYPTRTGPNRRLGRFVTEQRRLHRVWQQGQLAGEDLQRFPDRVVLLERIQFRWAMQGPEAGNEGARGRDGSEGAEGGDDHGSEEGDDGFDEWEEV